MPRISDFAVICQIEQNILSIRKTVTLAEMPMFIGNSYGSLAKYLDELGELPADNPFVAYHSHDMQAIDVEAGFAVRKLLPGRDDIKAYTLPESKAVFCMYKGAYREIQPVYEDMLAWIKEQGYKAKDVSYEYYYNGQGFPEEDFLTKLLIPVD